MSGHQNPETQNFKQGLLGWCLHQSSNARNAVAFEQKNLEEKFSVDLTRVKGGFPSQPIFPGISSISFYLNISRRLEIKFLTKLTTRISQVILFQSPLRSLVTPE